MKKIIFTLFLMALVSWVVGQDVRSSASGFSINANGIYSSWSSESFFLGELAEIDPNGTGFNLGVGYGFNQRFSAHLHYSNANFNMNDEWDAFNVTSIDLTGRISFGATLKALKPYLGAGISSVSMKVDPVTFGDEALYELKNSGLGFIFNGGVDYFIKTNLSVGLQGELNIGSFSDISLSGQSIELDESVDFSYFKINLGVRYYFD